MSVVADCTDRSCGLRPSSFLDSRILALAILIGLDAGSSIYTYPI